MNHNFRPLNSKIFYAAWKVLSGENGWDIMRRLGRLQMNGHKQAIEKSMAWVYFIKY